MFRTGDYGRLLPNGHFEIHGRKDSQVKLKGYHIELEEIGEAMMRHPQVTAAAAVVKDKTHLVGYFTPASVDVEELRTLVASYLPVYMVPAVWVPLESMPQNVSGKTHRLALEALNISMQVEDLETDLEYNMAAVWSQVLGVNATEIGVNTSFFALGGDSISAIRLVAKAKQFGFHLTSALVMKHSTLRSMLQVCKVESSVKPERREIGRPNVKFVGTQSFEEIETAILEVEKSLDLIHGPVYAVTVFTTPSNDQYLQFTVHHTVIDLVSWRVLIDDLETLLRGKSLGPKSMSFKEWSELLTAKATEWDPAHWNEYLFDDAIPPTNPSHVSLTAYGELDESVASQLNIANTKYGTNIQELALAALTGSLAELRGSRLDKSRLAVMLEGHGREPWMNDIDITSTLGWFTCEYPVVFTGSNDIGDLLRQVKQKLRGVPDKWLSYGAIKYLSPPSESTQKVKAHRHHNIGFNYMGRFQEMNAEDGLFDQTLSPGNLILSHSGDKLVMTATMADWQFSPHELETWMALWVSWMSRIVEHCLDPATVGGRTLSDLPLLGSTEVVRDVETELLSTLHLRPCDIDDIYPATPLQSGLLYAMLQDPSEYVLQAAIDIRGDFDFTRFKSCWTKLARQTDILRTVFVSTPNGIFQAVTKEDFTEWQLYDDVWSVDTLAEQSEAYYTRDRQRGFTLESRSFQRFCGVRVSDGRLRVFWTNHHSVADGWSLPILLNNFMTICYGENVLSRSAPFKNHIEWLLKQDTESSKGFWKKSLEHLDKTAPLMLPKPSTALCESGTKYSSTTKSVRLPEMKDVCKHLGTTPSTIFRAAWAIVLQQYTRCEYVKFGSVISGRDTDVDGADQMIGVMINTVPILAHVSSELSLEQVISDMHNYSIDLVRHSHCGISDIKTWSNAKTADDIFETIIVYENYPSVDTADDKIDRAFSLRMIEMKEYADAKMSIAIVPELDEYFVKISYNNFDISTDLVHYVQDRYLQTISKLSSLGSINYSVSALDTPSDHEQLTMQSSCFGREVALPYELLHQAFEERAATKPHLHAVEYESHSITYGDLDQQASTLARHLMSLGVGVGSRVAVIMERCLEFPIGLLAVLKAGGSMMPLVATLPPNRLTFMLGDANATVVVSTKDYRAQIEALELTIPVVYISSTELAASPLPLEVESKATRHHEAFVVYTSGSTGRPKGVPVLHEGAVNCIAFDLGDLDISDGMRMMQFRAIGSDVFQWEVWKALSRGAALVFRSDNVFDTLKTVDILSCTPTGLALLGDPTQYPNLKLVKV
ncbi:hypothetical protein AeMF1_006238 [Aphanomyces euteiches]|nr:hypothetical protein AeMF1_006238 [Aphanomyces euteiches]